VAAGWWTITPDSALCNERDPAALAGFVFAAAEFGEGAVTAGGPFARASATVRQQIRHGTGESFTAAGRVADTLAQQLLVMR